jgi:hypothetical protein
MEKGTWTLIMPLAPATSQRGYIDGLGMCGRRYGSGYETQIGRRRVRV